MGVVMDAVNDTIIQLEGHIEHLRSHGAKSRVVIINTNPTNESSKIYIRNKTKFMLENGVDKVDILEITTLNEVKRFLTEKQDKCTSVILQLPLNDEIKSHTDFLLGLIKKEKDLDRLSNEFLLSTRNCDLPATARGMKMLIENISYRAEVKNILFIGFGKTTNRNLFLNMFNEGKYQCRVANSKTTKEELNNSIKWADVIISSTGIPESLNVIDKIVISPTIHKSEDGKWVTDLDRNCVQFNDTNKALGTIGQITLRAITANALGDAVIQNKHKEEIPCEYKIGGTE